MHMSEDETVAMVHRAKQVADQLYTELVKQLTREQFNMLFQRETLIDLHDTFNPEHPIRRPLVNQTTQHLAAQVSFGETLLATKGAKYA
jgi:hypothetical protein